MSLQPDPTRFYVLESVEGLELDIQKKDLDKIVVTVADIRLPGYFDSQKILIFVGSNEIKYAIFRLWAEPLDRRITEILAENLVQRTKISSTYAIPTRSLIKSNIELRLDIEDFSLKPNNRVELIARWRFTGRNAVPLYASNNTSIQLPLQISANPYVDYYTSIVSTMSSAIGRLADTIAQDLENIIHNFDLLP